MPQDVYPPGPPDQDGKPTPSDGKVNASRYNAKLKLDLGLCYETFYTNSLCRHGTECWWRHSWLTQSEVQWLAELGAGHVVEFMDLNWSSPEVPELTPWDPSRLFTV